MRDSREILGDIRFVRECMDVMLDLSGLSHACVIEDERLWRPPSDMYETKEELVIIIEVAGMCTEDFRVRLVGHHLVVSGERREYPIEAKTAYHNWEIDSGHFERMFFIPENIDTEGIKADYHYENGYLVINLPKKKESFRDIPIE